MIKLTNEVKRMLNALAYANEAEYLTLPQKHRALAGGTAPTLAADPTPAKKSGPHRCGHRSWQLCAGNDSYSLSPQTLG